MKEATIVYLDDNYDNYLIDAFSQHDYSKDAGIQDIAVRFCPIKFSSSQYSLNTFLSNRDIQQSWVILVDSKLFSTGKKFYGEELIGVLKRYLHFVTFILITQEANYEEINAFSKAQLNQGEDPIQYYEEGLLPKVIEGIRNRKVMEDIFASPLKTKALEPYLADVRDGLCGEHSYERLSSADLDSLIELIKQCINE